MKLYKLLMPVALIAATIVSASAEKRLQRDITYTANPDEYAQKRCKLDVSYDSDKSGLPVIVWFHGGGLTGGEKSIPREIDNGDYMVVAANYRLIPQVSVAECIDDAAAAVAWAFANAEQYGGDPKKIIVSGHSAGGYLTSMVGFDKHWLAKYGVDADSIAMLVPFSGQAVTHYSHRKTQGIGELQATIDEYAPLTHIRPDAPPYVIICGDREEELYGRYEENAYLWRMLKLVGHPEVYIYEIGGHDHGQMVGPSFLILKKHIRKLLDR